MPSGKQPTVRMRRIGSALRQAREAKGMKLSTACRLYGRSAGWFSTVENGTQAITPCELADLLDFYEVSDGLLRESLLHLARRPRSRGWQRPYEGRISAAALDLMSLEHESRLIRAFHPTIIPGLLQTRDYARCLFEAGSSAYSGHIPALLDFRLDRQKVLTSPNPPDFTAVVHESVLHHPMGSASVMRAQLRQLFEWAHWPHIHIHVLPFAKSAYLGLSESFLLLTLRPPGALTVSVLEHLARSLFVDDEEEMAKFVKIFERLLSAALSEEESLKLLEGVTSRA
ncbi:helix-turn-helix domain-containing protein [Spirillospora sp. CA-253888]